MEVFFHAQHNRFVLRHLLGFVRPLPRNLDRRFDRLGAGVHWEHHVEAKELGDKLSEAGKDIVVECS